MHLHPNSVRRYFNGVILTGDEDVIDVSSDHRKERSRVVARKWSHTSARVQISVSLSTERWKKKNRKRIWERGKRLRINCAFIKRGINKETDDEHSDQLRQVRAGMAKTRVKIINNSSFSNTEWDDRSMNDSYHDLLEVLETPIIDKDKVIPPISGAHSSSKLKI